MKCAKGESYSQGQCWKSCPPGYTGTGPQCLRDCPVGFHSLDTACLKPVLQRGAPIAPKLSDCAPNQRDDGLNCWNTLECSYIPNGNRMELVCTGTNSIGTPFASRQVCPSGYSLFNGTCYVSCPTGYDSVGGLCAKRCPSGYTDVLSNTGLPGLQCGKPSIGRDFGGPILSGLFEITSDARKSTLLQRYAATQSTTSAVSTTLVQHLSSSWDPFQWIEDLLNDLPQIITLLKIVGLIAILYFVAPIITPFVGIIGATLTPVGKGLGTAVGSVGSAAGKVVEGTGSFVGSAITSTGKAVGQSIVEELK